MRPGSIHRALACAAALAVALSATAHADGPDDPLAGASLDVVAYQLDNGLSVVLHRDASTPTVAVHLWYRVGSKDEVAGRSGFAHLFEHLMFKGSKHVPDGAFDTLLEAAGGSNNGSTSPDRTDYYEVLPANQLGLALYLEADRMVGMWDAMDQEKLDNQRGVVKNERRQSYDNRPYGVADLEVQQALWPKGHGNHNLTIGTMTDLNAASLADVEAFYRSYYAPNNAILVIAGNVEEARARALVDKYFGWMPRRPEPELVSLDEPVKPRESAVRLDLEDAVSVPKLIYAWRAPEAYSPAEAHLTIAADILAGGKTSRLYKRLVFDERLATRVSAYNLPQSLGSQFHISTIAKEGADPERIAAIIDEELARLASDGPTDDELVRARNSYLAGKFRALESLQARAAILARYTGLAGNPDYLRQDVERYVAANAADVRAAVAGWLKADARVVALVSPRAPAPASRPASKKTPPPEAGPAKAKAKTKTKTKNATGKPGVKGEPK